LLIGFEFGVNQVSMIRQATQMLTKNGSNLMMGQMTILSKKPPSLSPLTHPRHLNQSPSVD
jgi:hypothetical protein